MIILDKYYKLDALVNNICVIIRSAHERTEGFCLHLIKRQVAQDKIFVIHERPFHAALKRSYEIGIDANFDWTLCVDADVLVTAQAIGQLIHFSANQSENCFGSQGLLLDKLRLGRRRAGMHLYRTRYLSQAISFINNSHDFYNQIRPETYIKQKMSSLGFGWMLSDNIAGLHDFEQYYVDIFRKMVVRARKSKNEYSSLISRIKLLSYLELDYKIAYLGLQAGHLNEGEIALDFEQWLDQANEALNEIGLEEKKPLKIVDDSLVERVFNTYSRRFLILRKYFCVQDRINRYINSVMAN